MAFHSAGDEDQPPSPIVHHVYHTHRHYLHHYFSTPEHIEADRQYIEQHLKPQLEAQDPPGPLVHHHHYFYPVQVPPVLNHQDQQVLQEQEGATEVAVAEEAQEHGDNIQVQENDGAEHGNVQEEGNNNEADQEQGNNNEADQEDGAADGNNDVDGM